MFLRLLAFFLSRPRVTDWLIARAQRTPYTHLSGYMDRYWLFNPYQDAQGQQVPRNWLMRRLPSIRLHYILRADIGRHMHDHPWDARTFILRGWYTERREGLGALIFRAPGDTARLSYGEFHHIVNVSPHGVWTLFITGRYRGTWGFKVNGRKIPWTEY